MKKTLKIRLYSYTVRGIDNRDGSHFEDNVILTQYDRGHEKKIRKLFEAKAFTVTEIIPEGGDQRMVELDAYDLWKQGTPVEDQPAVARRPKATKAKKPVAASTTGMTPAAGKPAAAVGA